ncbi:MAG: hypothetical protein GY880_22850 [Planctomycetaceae bacterium]|nr:hypothetical protein [Planctomycetaceae bacterium]
MPTEFDPYLTWLGIQSTERPLDHYALLGLTRFESSEELIDQHSVQRIELLQDIATGSDQVELSQKILNEISAARICLLDRRKRAKYDLQLKKQIAGFDSAVSRIERLSASEESTKKNEPSEPPIHLAISTGSESKKHKSGENPIPRISKRKKQWVFPLVAMVIPLLMGIGVLIGVYIFVTPQLREDFDKLNYGRTNVIETSHEDELLGDPLNLNQTPPEKSTEGESLKNTSSQKLPLTPSSGSLIASYYADPTMVDGIDSNLSTAISPEKQDWVYDRHASDFSDPVPAENSMVIAWKTGDKEFDGVDFRKTISASEFDRLYDSGWQLTVIARLISGSYRFQVSPSRDSNYWKGDQADKQLGYYSIHLKKTGKSTKFSVAGNEQSIIASNKNLGFVRIELKGAPKQDNCTFKVYPFEDGQNSAKPIGTMKNLKPGFQNWRSSQLSMSTTGPRKGNSQNKKPRASLSEIWIHKVELRALK